MEFVFEFKRTINVNEITKSKVNNVSSCPADTNIYSVSLYIYINILFERPAYANTHRCFLSIYLYKT
jgi:hypothetical protein